MVGNCDSLKALEITQELCLEEYPGINDLLFSHFPSLVYVRLSHVRYSIACKYTISNCHQLKYLYYESDFYESHLIFPSSNNYHLQQLCVDLYVGLSTSSVQVLSAHRELEQVVLLVKSITTSAITTLISNSPT